MMENEKIDKEERRNKDDGKTNRKMEEAIDMKEK